MMELEKQNCFKIVLLGDAGVGKTCICLRIKENTFKSQLPTIGAAFHEVYIKIDPAHLDNNTSPPHSPTNAKGGYKSILLNIWDTAGQEKYRSVVPIYYKKASAALVVYDVTNRESYKNTHKWVAELHETNPQMKIVLVANKVDMIDRIKVDKKEAVEYAEANDIWFREVSAKEGFGVKQLFEDLGNHFLTIPNRDEYFITEERHIIQHNQQAKKESSCSC